MMYREYELHQVQFQSGNGGHGAQLFANEGYLHGAVHVGISVYGACIGGYAHDRRVQECGFVMPVAAAAGIIVCAARFCFVLMVMFVGMRVVLVMIVPVAVFVDLRMAVLMIVLIAVRMRVDMGLRVFMPATTVGITLLPGQLFRAPASVNVLFVL